jgi:predicted DNA-binding transcriptional regulator AlpA
MIVRTSNDVKAAAAPPSAVASKPVEKISFRVKEAALASGLSRATLFNEMKAGRLRSVKVAGVRLILRADLEAYLSGRAEAA